MAHWWWRNPILGCVVGADGKKRDIVDGIVVTVSMTKREKHFACVVGEATKASHSSEAFLFYVVRTIKAYRYVALRQN